MRLRPREAGIVLGSLPPGGLNAITDVPGVAEHVGGAHPAATQLPPTQPASLISDEPMLVPREAWQKALEQLGHLRPLAEQLTDASARAAKAETTEGLPPRAEPGATHPDRAGADDDRGAPGARAGVVGGRQPAAGAMVALLVRRLLRPASRVLGHDWERTIRSLGHAVVGCRRCCGRRYREPTESPPAVDWRFTTEDARIKLKRLYPSVHS